MFLFAYWDVCIYLFINKKECNELGLKIETVLNSKIWKLNPLFQNEDHWKYSISKLRIKSENFITYTDNEIKYKARLKLVNNNNKVNNYSSSSSE